MAFSNRGVSLTVAAVLLASGATPLAARKDKDERPASQGASAEPENPYPSTYRPYGGRPTVLRGATIFDGEGGRIDNGVVFLSEGKVTAIGGADTPIPADVVVIDAQGKYVTPGVIDIHSHLGDYPSPGVDALSDGNEATSPVTPMYGRNIAFGHRTPAFPARSPMAA